MYLITGGTGFVGSYVVRQLVDAGAHFVIFDSNPDLELLGLLIGTERAASLPTVRGDITDLAHLLRVCQNYGVDRVIHTAAVIGAQNPALTVRVNCDGTLNILEAARVLKLSRVVLTSSLAVFGPHRKYPQEYIPNDAPHAPSSIYGACKSLDEVCARHYATEYGLDVLAIRLLGVYGFGRKGARILKTHEELFVNPALGRPGRVPNGETIQNWQYVEDAARALVMASQVPKTTTKAFSTDGDIRSTASVASYVKDLIANADITLLPGASELPYRLDTAPVRDEVGYRPEWPMERGVKKFIEDIREFHSVWGDCS